MKHACFLILLFFFFIYHTTAQRKPSAIHFKKGDFIGNGNLTKGKFEKSFLANAHFKKKYYVLLQFDQIPGSNERNELSKKGILLFNYLPSNAFMAELPDSFSSQDLMNYHATGIYNLDPRFKISAKLGSDIDERTYKPDNLTAVSFFGSMKRDDVIKEIESKGAQIVSTKIKPSHILFLKASSTTLKRITSLPFVEYVTHQVLKDTPLNYNNHAIHALDALGALSGRNLQGKNVTIGVGDNADPQSHVDFTGRLIDRNPNVITSHGTHTVGTTGGAGLVNPKYKGMAPKATLISQNFSDILVNAPVYIKDFNMVLTNNSYYSGANGCNGEGEYDALANYADDQIYAGDSLLHVFAAGNDGGLTCSPYQKSFATIKSGFQCGKNVLTVGAIDNLSYLAASFSSRGPVNDGRIKPEIIAGGATITSTLPYNTYGISVGTSMSAPTVTGTLGLLYERYRQLHGGTNPSSALIKAVACNSADDLGNPGPDYTYGFGMLNARTAVEALENNHYFTGNISNSGIQTHTVSLPAAAQQLKIMLYWNDPAAATSVGPALVNNLDLIVTEPDGATTHHPLILNPDPAHVADNAVEGTDNLNNIEQVVINGPGAGNYTITINGTSVPASSQDYVIAYEIINPSVTVEYPFGNETWVPGETEYIRWSAYGGDPNTFTLEYSTDDGTSWNTITNNAAAAARSYAWVVPNIPTNKALIRVTRNTVNYSDVSDYDFVILGQPSITLTNPCQGYAQLKWNAINSATGYEIMTIKGDSMQTIANTTDTSYLLQGLNRNSTYWFTVRAINGSTAGRRAIAASIIPNGGACTLSGKDFSVDSLIAPGTGRQHTSTELSSSSVLTIRIKNLGTLASSSPIPVSYQVNGGPVITENIISVIAANTAYNYNFSMPYDFSNVGTYTIKTWVSYPGDTLNANDTLVTIIKQLQNDTLSLNPSYTEGFESADTASYIINTTGFKNLDRCDFLHNNNNGRARTFIDNGFARTGNRCVTLDQVFYSSTTTADSLITTFNLSNYSSGDQIWLDYYYRNQGIDFAAPGNNVWIRGNDQSAWILADTLSTSPSSFGIYLPSKSINVTDLLSKAIPAQNISSSFQIKFGEEGKASANSVTVDGDIDDGFSFDDITITRASNDIAILSLVSPNTNGICNLSNAESVKVMVHNYSATVLNNVSVSYSINGTVVTETIPAIAAHDTIVYTFNQTADLSAYKNYDLRAWVHVNGDTYPKNDSLPDIVFQTVPVISSFPYLEGFENNNGYWDTNGINDSWQWGAPAKTIINKAANGNNAWVTNLTGNYADNQSGYLYSPCFDLSSLAHPVLSFSHIFQTEDDCDCDYHWVEYSTDGINWQKLGTVGNGTNWYDNATKKAWQLSDTIWHVSSFDIPTNGNQVRFRFVMFSDPAVDYEGVGIDDVHIFDKDSIYAGPNISSGLSQNVSGDAWINFTNGGNVIVSINPNGQDLGNTNVKVYLFDSSSRNISNQYYLNRNIVIHPENQPTDSVSVRFYFLDSEADSLINAKGCATCTSIHDAYKAGITQYSNDIPDEDSTLSNNTNGTYQFILPGKNVAIIPNNNGYYAEYKVKGFSEFWINGGGINQNQPLALVLQSFTAVKINNYQALLQWSIISGTKTKEFIIEKSSDSISFTAIDSISFSNSLTNYQYTDSLLKGTDYYRLKIIDSSGNYQYSVIRSVDNNYVTSIKIYPNPVEGRIVYILTPANCKYIQLIDMVGRIVTTVTTSGTENMLTIPGIASGIYFVVVQTDKEKKVKKIFVK
ncbi:MAG TPA: S8 family serine peptidase [Puia sp.]|nr:S8 family serine peptidase [Puia sp.]